MSEKKLRLVHFEISDENEARKMALLHHVMRMFSGPLHFILYGRSDVTIQQSTVGSLQRSANMIKCDKKKKRSEV